MITVNVEVRSKLWHKKIKNLKKYLNKKLNKISKVVPTFKKKRLNFIILLTNSSNMRQLNRKFRNRNKPTDVLSFLPLSNLKLIKGKEIYIGDVALSYEVINLRSKKSNFIKEFDKVWVHGLLHLLGYKHFKNKDYIKMSKIEQKIANLIV